MLLVRPNTLRASEKRLMRSRRPASVCDVKAESCANNISRTRTFHTFVCTEARKIKQVAVVSGVDVDALLSSAEGIARQQREKDAEECRGENAALFDSAFDEEGLEGHPILCRSVKRFDLLTMSNALIKSMEAMYKGRLCSRHFS